MNDTEKRINKMLKKSELILNAGKPKQQINEEWLRSCTTEQLAEKLTDFSFWLVVELPTNERREKVRNKLLEWLKRPHITTYQ